MRHHRRRVALLGQAQLMPSPAFDAMLAAILDLAQPIVLAALIVGLVNELAETEES